MCSCCLSEPESIGILDSTARVLDLLNSSKEPLGVNSIAKACSLYPSSCFRILQTLRKTGWAYQMNDTRYISGSKLSFLTEKNSFLLALRDVSKFIMEECTSRHGIAMNLIVRNGTDCIILQQSLTKSLIDYTPPLDAVLPYYACGGGKVLLCELPEAEIRQLMSRHKIEALTPYTITDEGQYLAELKNVAERGYAIDFKESSIYGSCVAVPVRDKSGAIVASLSFTGLIGLSDPKFLLKYIPVLRDTSQRITTLLYCSWCADEKDD